jgi:uncharacterized protein YndB with AHSA1/START domain
MYPVEEQAPVVHASFSIERTYPASPSKVFFAFADQATKRRWFAEGEAREVSEHSLEFKAGGREVTRSRFKSGGPPGGGSMRNDTVYLDIVPDKRIVMAYTMTIGEHRISASLVTVELAAVAGGTRLFFTEQSAFFVGADGRERREEGWGKLLDRLGAEFRKG